MKKTCKGNGWSVPVRLVAGLLLLVTAWSSHAASFDQSFREGVHYEVIAPAESGGDGKVEVVEMLWYGCGSCYAIQPYVQRWLETKPEGVVYRRMPAILNAGMSFHARTFYTAQALGVLGKVHEPLFSAIHDQQRRLDTEQSLAAFFTRRGVDEESFRRTFNSPVVASKVIQARNASSRYGIRGAPSLIVNGRYLTDPTHVSSAEELIMVMDYLVERELQRLQRE
jgi:thiol:disulfide interchange protein DsbA